MRHSKLAVLLSLLVVMIVAATPGTAFALFGDMYHEVYPDIVPGWRGVSGNVYNNNWSLVPPDGRHVSSLYIHTPYLNPVPGDGYNDGLPHYYVHLEVGLEKIFGVSSIGFWQYNPDWTTMINFKKNYFLAPVYYSYSVPLKITNASMGGFAPDTWRIYNGETMVREVELPFIAGEALCSAEREYDSPAESNDALFNNLMRKNSQGNWAFWMDAQPIADGDSDYRFVKYADYYLGHEEY